MLIEMTTGENLCVREESGAILHHSSKSFVTFEVKNGASDFYLQLGYLLR